MGIRLVQAMTSKQVVRQRNLNLNLNPQLRKDLIDQEVFLYSLVIIMVNQIVFKVKLEILEIEIDTKLLVIEIFNKEMDIGVLVTRMFNNIQNFSKIHGIIMGGEGIKIIISKGQKIREVIGTLAIKDLVEIISLVQQRDPRHQ